MTKALRLPPLPKLPKPPKPSRPFTVKPVLPKISKPPVIGKGPRSTIAAQVTQWDNLPALPPGFVGTYPEFLVYWALTKLGYQPDLDFTFQSSQLGVRWEAGAAVVDFLISNRTPPLVIRVQGMYWHYEQGTDKQALDLIQKQELELHGLEVVDVDEDDIVRNPIYYVQQALAGIDLSQAAKGRR